MPPARQVIRRRALRLVQDADHPLYVFALTAEELAAVADVSRVSRDDAGKLIGYQRPEVKRHVQDIVAYLNGERVIFPNPIILALSSRVTFTLAAEFLRKVRAGQPRRAGHGPGPRDGGGGGRVQRRRDMFATTGGASYDAAQGAARNPGRAGAGSWGHPGPCAVRCLCALSANIRSSSVIRRGSTGSVPMTVLPEWAGASTSAVSVSLPDRVSVASLL